MFRLETLIEMKSLTEYGGEKGRQTYFELEMGHIKNVSGMFWCSIIHLKFQNSHLELMPRLVMVLLNWR